MDSEKLKEFLKRKLEDYKLIIIKKKKKKKKIMIIYITIILSSIVVSTLAASLVAIPGIPVIAISVFCATGGILTGISTKFNFQRKKKELTSLIEDLNQIQLKLDYVINSNGNLGKKEYDLIMKEMKF